MLKEQFPNQIGGEVIVARECLVDGEVKSDNLEELFQKRALFMTQEYNLVSEDEYYKLTVD